MLGRPGLKPRGPHPGGAFIFFIIFCVCVFFRNIIARVVFFVVLFEFSPEK